MAQNVHIVGGGLAGCEAAWQCLMRGLSVVLYEMRPSQMTPAHKTGDLAELVCSNSFKSLDPLSAPGMLKTELAMLQSLILEAAFASRVPAGQALAIDRSLFSRYVDDRLNQHPRFERKNVEVTALPPYLYDPVEQRDRQLREGWIIASGPLTSPSLAASLDALIRVVNPEISNRLFFYDAIAPTLAADSIDWDKVFCQSRYEKGGDDYVNLPLTKEEYELFIQAVEGAEYMPLHEFESTKYFESCLPIEVMVARGKETLRFGPMKPVGLIDPRTGRRPWAAIQLRKENLQGTMYSMVGFQTKMKWPEQKRVFGLIPALRQAEFLRYGSVHRNTYVQSPYVLSPDLSLRGMENIFLAGQITGVEGYLESAAMGLLAGRNCADRLLGKATLLPPAESMIGALLRYVTKGAVGPFQPMNCNFGILPLGTLALHRDKRKRREEQVKMARESFEVFQKADLSDRDLHC